MKVIIRKYYETLGCSSFCLILCTLLSCYSKDTNHNYSVFKYNQSTGINSLDPAFSKDLATMWACSHLYEGLFILDSNAKLSNLLAESFQINEDKLIYTFQLKRNVYFHKNNCFKSLDSTRILNAYDVVYSLSRLINPQTASPGSWVLKNKLDTIEPFKIIDSFQFQIKLRSPNAQFLQVLSMPYCSVIPKEAVEYYGKDFRKNPVGTGAFQFKLWDDGTALFLKKNPNYHIQDTIGKSLPYIDFVKITFNENKKTELLSFEKGDLSFITGLNQSMIQEVFDENGAIKPKWAQSANVILKPFLNTEYFAILYQDSLLDDKSPLKHKKIRQAINYSLNRKELVQYLKRNLTIPANKGFVSSGMPNYDTSFIGYEYRPALAKKLISESGYSISKKPSIKIHINNDFIEMAELMTYQLTEVGFDVEIKLHPADMMMQLATNGTIDFFRRSWFADYPDAENYLACFYSKNSTPPNYSRFSNKEFDRLYEEIIIETDLEKRKNLYKKMEKIIIEEAPIVPIFYDQSIRIIQKNISGLEQNVVNTLDLRKIKIYCK